MGVRKGCGNGRIITAARHVSSRKKEGKEVDSRT